MELDTIILGDSRQLLTKIPTESIDCIVSDIPYTIAHHGSNCGGGIFADYKPLGGGINKRQKTWNSTRFIT